MDNIKAFGTRLSSHRYFGLAVVVAVVLLGNILYITNFFNANPINTRSGLLNSYQPGPLTGYYTIDPSDGYYAQALGHRAAVDLAHGNLPWWNHYEGVGAPLVGGMQSGALFPLQFLLAMPNGLFYFHLALELIAAIATYYFLKRLRCHEAAAIVGGIAFGLNGTFAWLGHTIVNPIAFLPALLLGIELAVQSAKDGRRRGWVLIALAVAASLYAGFPETGFLNTLFAGGWALVRLAVLQRQQYVAYFKKLALGALVGLGLAAPVLLAFIGYLPDANVGLHASSTAEATLPQIGIAGLFMPYLYGPIFGYAGFDPILNSWWAVVGGFISLTVLLLACYGVFVRRQARLAALTTLPVAYLVGWTVVMVCATYGLLKLNHVVGSLPAISSIVFARYLPPTYIMALTILMALGLTVVFQKRPGLVRLKPIMSTALAGVLLVVVGYCLGHPERVRLAAVPAEHTWFYASIAFALLTVMAVTVGLVFGRRIWARGLLVLIVAADVLVMYIVPQFSAPRHAAINLQPVMYLRQNLGNQRFFSLGPIAPNYGTYYKIASVNINDIPQAKSYSQYITNKLNPNTNPITFTGTDPANRNGISPLDAFFKYMDNYQFIGVKYLVTARGMLSPQQVADHKLRLVHQDATADILQLPAPKSYFDSLDGACKIAASDRDHAMLDCSRAATIVRREQYLPGWSASLSGGSIAKVSEYAGLLQQVAVPTGKHDITFDYTPPHMAFGYAAAAISLLTVVFYGLPFAAAKEYLQRQKNSSL